MPIYSVDARTCTVGHESRLVDTNILVGYFNESDNWHSPSKTYLDYLAEIRVVPIFALSVAVEAWGLLGPTLGDQMVSWITQPGNAELLPDDHTLVPEARAISAKFKTDLVDALLAVYAVTVTAACGLPRPLPIATFDQRNWGIWESMDGKLVYVNPENDEPYF